MSLGALGLQLRHLKTFNIEATGSWQAHLAGIIICGCLVLVLLPQVLDYWVFGRIFCDIWAAVDVLCCTASIMSLCVISIDRYIGVRWPLQYPTIVTEKRALLAMLGVWVLAFVISVGPLFGWKQPPSQVEFWQIFTKTIFTWCAKQLTCVTLRTLKGLCRIGTPLVPSLLSICSLLSQCSLYSNSFQFSPWESWVPSSHTSVSSAPIPEGRPNPSTVFSPTNSPRSSQTAVAALLIELIKTTRQPIIATDIQKIWSPTKLLHLCLEKDFKF